MKWNIPNNLDYRYLAYVPSYTLKYFNIKDNNVTGFLSDIWHGVSSVATGVWHGVSAIPKAVFGTGYVIAKHDGNVNSAVRQGVTDVSHVLNPSLGIAKQGWHSFPEPKQTVSPAQDFLHTIGKIGGEAASDILTYKIEKAAGMLNKTPNQVWNEGTAWTMAHQPQLENMGYPSPESATDAALWYNNGYPPTPTQQPSSLFHNISSDLEKYWWILALGAAVLIISRR